jgi:hypothetical protein
LPPRRRLVLFIFIIRRGDAAQNRDFPFGAAAAFEVFSKTEDY